jgi:hypothetical protein
VLPSAAASAPIGDPVGDTGELAWPHPSATASTTAAPVATNSLYCIERVPRS